MPESKPVKKIASVKKAAPAKKASAPKVEPQPIEVHETVMDLPQEKLADVIVLHPAGMIVVPLAADDPRASAPPPNDDPKIGMARLLRLRQQGR